MIHSGSVAHRCLASGRRLAGGGPGSWRSRATEVFGHGGGAVMYVEFFVHVLEVRVDRAGRDAENGGDLLIGVAGGEKFEDVELALREAVEVAAHSFGL